MFVEVTRHVVARTTTKLRRQAMNVSNAPIPMDRARRASAPISFDSLRARLALLLVCGALAPRLVAGVPCVGLLVEKVYEATPQVVHGFAYSVAIDGDTVVAGAPGAYAGDDGSGPFSGRVFLFTRVWSHTGDQWVAGQTLDPNPISSGAEFGAAVGIDGDWLVVGAPSTSVGGNSWAGAVHLFERVRDPEAGPVWTHRQMITAPTPSSSDRFGYQVALRGDRLIVGGPQAKMDGILSVGRAWIFELQSNGEGASSWAIAASLTPVAPFTSGFFGESVAIDGDRAFVGAPGTGYEGLQDAGRGFTFVRTQGGDGEAVWSLESELDPPMPKLNGVFGNSAALEADTLLVGARVENDQGGTDGAVHSFTHDGRPFAGSKWPLLQTITSPQPWFGVSIALEVDRLVIGNPMLGQDGAALLYTRTPSEREEGSWSYAATFTSSDGSINHFAKSVGISGTRVVVGDDFALTGEGRSDMMSTYGAAFIFRADCEDDCVDLNGDANVDGADLTVLLGEWGPCASCASDFDSSGEVDGADIAALLGAWGPCP